MIFLGALGHGTDTEIKSYKTISGLIVNVYTVAVSIEKSWLLFYALQLPYLLNIWIATKCTEI